MPTTRGLISSNKLSFPFSLPSLFFSSEVSDLVGNASEIIKRAENASLVSLCYSFSSPFFLCALTRFSSNARKNVRAYIKCTSLISQYITQYLIIERLSRHLNFPSPPTSQIRGVSRRQKKPPRFRYLPLPRAKSSEGENYTTTLRSSHGQCKCDRSWMDVREFLQFIVLERVFQTLTGR